MIITRLRLPMVLPTITQVSRSTPNSKILGGDKVVY